MAIEEQRCVADAIISNALVLDRIQQLVSGGEIFLRKGRGIGLHHPTKRETMWPGPFIVAGMFAGKILKERPGHGLFGEDIGARHANMSRVMVWVVRGPWPHGVRPLRFI